MPGPSRGAGKKARQRVNPKTADRRPSGTTEQRRVSPDLPAQQMSKGTRQRIRKNVRNQDRQSRSITRERAARGRRRIEASKSPFVSSKSGRINVARGRLANAIEKSDAEGGLNRAEYERALKDLAVVRRSGARVIRGQLAAGRAERAYEKTIIRGSAHVPVRREGRKLFGGVKVGEPGSMEDRIGRALGTRIGGPGYSLAGVKPYRPTVGEVALAALPVGGEAGTLGGVAARNLAGRAVRGALTAREAALLPREAVASIRAARASEAARLFRPASRLTVRSLGQQAGRGAVGAIKIAPRAAGSGALKVLGHPVQTGKYFLAGDVATTGSLHKGLSGQGPFASATITPPIESGALAPIVNLAKDALALPANAIPMMYLPAAAVVHYGVTGDASQLETLWEGLKESDAVTHMITTGDFREALKLAGEHPLYTALILGGATRVAGRAAGGVSRLGSQAARDRVVMGGRRSLFVDSKVGDPNMEYQRAFSPDAIIQAFQRMHDAHVRANPQGIAGRHRLRKEKALGPRLIDRQIADEAAEIGRLSNEVNLTLDRLYKSGLTDDMGPALLAFIERTVRPETLTDDLDREILRLERKGAAMKEGNERKRNRATVYALRAVDRDPERWVPILEEAREAYADLFSHFAAETAALGRLTPEQMMIAALKPALFVRSGGRIHWDPVRQTTVRDVPRPPERAEPVPEPAPEWQPPKYAPDHVRTREEYEAWQQEQRVDWDALYGGNPEYRRTRGLKNRTEQGGSPRPDEGITWNPGEDQRGYIMPDGSIHTWNPSRGIHQNFITAWQDWMRERGEEGLGERYKMWIDEEGGVVVGSLVKPTPELMARVEAQLKAAEPRWEVVDWANANWGESWSEGFVEPGVKRRIERGQQIISDVHDHDKARQKLKEKLKLQELPELGSGVAGHAGDILARLNKRELQSKAKHQPETDPVTEKELAPPEGGWKEPLRSGEVGVTEEEMRLRPGEDIRDAAARLPQGRRKRINREDRQAEYEGLFGEAEVGDLHEPTVPEPMDIAAFHEEAIRYGLGHWTDHGFQIDPEYVTHKSFEQTGLEPRGRISSNQPVRAHRTGERTLDGTVPATLRDIFNTPAKRVRSNERFRTLQTLLLSFQRTGKDGHTTFKTKREALDQRNPKTEDVINIDEFEKRDLIADAIRRGDSDAFDPEIIEYLEDPEYINRARAEGAGTWVIVHKTVIDRLIAHTSDRGPKRAPINRLTQQWKRVILTTTPTWYSGNYFQVTLQALLNRVMPPPLGFAGERAGIGAAAHGRTAMEALSERQAGGLVPGGLSEGAIRVRSRLREEPREKEFADHEKLGKLLLNAAHKLGTRKNLEPNRVIAGWQAYADFMLKWNSTLVERPVFAQILGKTAAREIRALQPIWKRGMRIQEKALKDWMDGKHGSANQLALADHINSQTGNWHSLSPNEGLVKDYLVPFYMWHRAAARFVWITVPRDHPVFTALLAAASAATQKQRMELGLDIWNMGDTKLWQQGSIPAPGGGLRQTSNLTAFGMWADYPGNLGASVAPFVSGIANSLKGVDWKGDKYVNRNGKDLSPLQRTALAAYLFLEPFIPAAGIANKVISRHRKTNIPLISYQGEKSGSFGSNLREAAIPTPFPGSRVYAPSTGGEKPGGKYKITPTKSKYKITPSSSKYKIK